MKKAIALTFIFFAFSKNFTYANSYRLYYLNNDEKLAFKNYIFFDNINEEEILLFLLQNMFEKTDAFKGIFIERGNLYLNFNENILNFTKGSFGEVSMITEVLNTCFQFKNINTVSFLKEGQAFYMPAGNFVFKYTIEDLKILNNNFEDNR